MEKWRINGFYSKNQLHRWQGQIPKRYSCRKFAKEPSVNQWTTLSYGAARFCLPGVRIVLAACDESFFTPAFLGMGRIEGATRFAAVLMDARIPHSLLHSGISGEAFVLEAASCGVSTCWVAGTYRKQENPVRPLPYESVMAVIPLGIEKETKEMPIRRKRKALPKIAEGVDMWPLWALEAAKAVQEAPSALNRQPWKLHYTESALELVGKDTLDRGIALLHMEAALVDVPHKWYLPAGTKEPALRVTVDVP